MKTILIIFATLQIYGCSTVGMTPEQIAARNARRTARYELYGKFLTGVAIGFIQSQLPPPQLAGSK